MTENINTVPSEGRRGAGPTFKLGPRQRRVNRRVMDADRVAQRPWGVALVWDTVPAGGALSPGCQVSPAEAGERWDRRGVLFYAEAHLGRDIRTRGRAPRFSIVFERSGRLSIGCLGGTISQWLSPTWRRNRCGGNLKYHFRTAARRWQAEALAVWAANQARRARTASNRGAAILPLPRAPRHGLLLPAYFAASRRRVAV